MATSKYRVEPLTSDPAFEGDQAVETLGLTHQVVADDGEVKAMCQTHDDAYDVARALNAYGAD